MTFAESGSGAILAMLVFTEALNNSTSCGRYPTCLPKSSRFQVYTSAPSNLTTPEMGFQTPTISFASVDFPEALAPMIPTIEPGSTEKDIPFIVGLLLPYGVKNTLSKSTEPLGVGNVIDCSLLGASNNSVCSLLYDILADNNIFQVLIAASNGARALPIRMDDAIIPPAVLCPFIANHAPTPITEICRTERMNFVMPSIMFDLLCAFICKALLRSFLLDHSETICFIIPIASSTSELRLATSM